MERQAGQSLPGLAPPAPAAVRQSVSHRSLCPRWPFTASLPTAHSHRQFIQSALSSRAPVLQFTGPLNAPRVGGLVPLPGLASALDRETAPVIRVESAASIRLAAVSARGDPTRELGHGVGDSGEASETTGSEQASRMAKPPRPSHQRGRRNVCLVLDAGRPTRQQRPLGVARSASVPLLAVLSPPKEATAVAHKTKAGEETLERTHLLGTLLGLPLQRVTEICSKNL